MLPESLDILSIHSLGEPKRRIHNITIKSKEVLSNLAGTGVFGVQSRHEHGGLALRVELVMDRSDGEHGALVLGQRARDFGIVAGTDEPVLGDEAEFERSLSECQEFGGARVDVRCVHAAGFEEAYGSRDAEPGEDRESIDVLRGEVSFYVLCAEDDTCVSGSHTAALVAPPLPAPVALLKSKTMRFLRSSPSRRVFPSPPTVRRRWKRLVADEAVRRSLINAVLSCGVVGGAPEARGVAEAAVDDVGET